MAYKPGLSEVKEELATVEKNSKGDFIKISKITTNGVDNIDIRLFYTSASGEILPTTKGVRFNAELLDEVIAPLAVILGKDNIKEMLDKME